MKTKTLKHTFSIAFLIILVACSTKKDTFLARNSHALSTRDNILYNGQIGLNKGIEGIKAEGKDNFWKRLPVERMQIKEDNTPDGKSKNANFELAEAKATKAIQKHSMNIGGQEKNYQIDEAYLLLGKARYYDQRFIPALDAFNYILYKYTNSSNIYQAKIWREKANMRLGNDIQVIKNISKLLDEKKLKKQNIADANALLAETFLNVEEKDSAIAKLKIAVNFTKVNYEKARYHFILGQLYQELSKRDSAIISYQSVINMNRKAEREYIIQAYAKKAQLFDFENGDANAFVKTYNRLVADRENRPFLDIIYYEMGVFYDKQNNQKLAKKFYNASLKTNSKDAYLVASNYRDLGNMHFKNTEYSIAAKYYDSTLVKMDVKTREYIHIKKVRKDLDEVIEYESVAKRNDSILNVVAMSDKDRNLYFEDYIGKLKKSDENKKILEEKQKAKLENIQRNSLTTADDPATGVQQAGKSIKKPGLAPPSITNTSANNTANTFYFYNPSTVAFGKVEFQKRWGNRALSGNWRLPSNTTNAVEEDVTDAKSPTSEGKAAEAETPQYTTAFYLDQLPKTQAEIDSIAKERNFAYYQLGVIYKEKFKEYQLASNKLDLLLQHNPEEKLVLPTMYNLYKIYQITNSAKAEEMKNRISSQYPDSRYAQIINNTNSNSISETETSENEYNKWYKLYQEEQFVFVLEKIDGLIIQFFGDEIVPKFELLKANTIGKLQGLEAYKKAMQFVADNYPNSEEGKNAQDILTTQIPLLEKLNFTTRDTKNWKILYNVGKLEDKSTKALEENIKKFIAGENINKLSYTYDIYTEKENFITVQGITSEAYAKNIASIMKDDKKYKITEPAIVISDENYKVVQIKKNLAEYLASPKVTPVSVQQAVVPQQTVPQPVNPDQAAPKQRTSKQGMPQVTRPPTEIPTTDDKDNPNPNSPPKP
ncbi:type IX secretion system periplasmic lipoprotein PorW/SprE [Flavobacterium soyangense]|uniref:type IX secretion system periplasmic lipoprotein PorW/SprE n=1 Tax=Flavobacterium soyangense TaxID=2023265 RepID=UPI001E3FB027|nr:gliding motility protein [Flavobacterium soyangense]